MFSLLFGTIFVHPYMAFANVNMFECTFISHVLFLHWHSICICCICMVFIALAWYLYLLYLHGIFCACMVFVFVVCTQWSEPLYLLHRALLSSIIHSQPGIIILIIIIIILIIDIILIIIVIIIITFIVISVSVSSLSWKCSHYQCKPLCVTTEQCSMLSRELYCENCIRTALVNTIKLF